MQKTFSENWCFETILFMAVNFFIAPKKDGKINGFRRNRRIRNNQSILKNRRFMNNLNNRIFPSSLLFNLYFLRLCVCTCCADNKRSVSDLRFNCSIFQSFNLPWGGEGLINILESCVRNQSCRDADTFFCLVVFKDRSYDTWQCES